MLQSMRVLAHSWPIKIVMLFLMVSFSIWGIGDIFRGNPLQNRVAKAGGTDISVQELNHMFEESLARARGVNPDMTTRQAKQMGVLDKTLDNAIKRTLVDQDIQRLGIDVPQEAVLKRLAEQPQLRTKDGKFNKDLFRQFLESKGKTEKTYLADSQHDMALQLLLESLQGTQTVPQTQIDALYKARAQKRILEVITVDSSKMTGIATPDDKILHEFYDANRNLFTAPEYRGITIAALSTDALTRDMSISDDQVKKEYDAKGDQLANPEQRDVVQVVVQDENHARQIAEAAHSSGDLAAAAKASGETAIPLDKIEEKNFLPELAKTVFALPQGQISAPVKTQLGWHIVQVLKIIPAGKPDFAAIKYRLREDMQRDQAVESATKTVNQLEDELAAGHSLDDIAESMKLRLIKIPALDATGLNPAGKEPSELPNKAVVLKDAFAQNAGENSPIEDDKAGNYTIVRTDDITPAAVKPFDAIKPAVIALWKSHEQLVKGQALADRIAKELRAGKLASSFISEDGVSVRTSSPISELGDSDPLLPPDILTQAMRLKKGEVTTSPSDRNQVIATVTQIVEADPAARDPRKNMISGDIKQSAGNDLLDQYVAHLNDVFTVKVDSELMDRLRQQDN